MSHRLPVWSIRFRLWRYKVWHWLATVAEQRKRRMIQRVNAANLRSVRAQASRDWLES